MPTIQEVLSKHRATLNSLEEVLESISEETWTHSPQPGTWCVAEVYDHIGRIAEGYSLLHLEACLSGQGKPGPKAWLGSLVMFLGKIPGGLRIRAPFPPELLPKVISKIEAQEILHRLRAKAEGLAPRVEHSDPNQRARHFRLGWLNAKEWYQFAEMHHRHHLEGQLRRLILQKK